MTELLLLIISLSLSGSILILLLFLAKPLYRNRLSRKWQYYIWIVVIARLLLPFSPEDSIMGNALQSAEDYIMGSALHSAEDYIMGNALQSAEHTIASVRTDQQDTVPTSDDTGAAASPASRENVPTDTRVPSPDDSTADSPINVPNSAASPGFFAAHNPDRTLPYVLLILYFGVALLLLLRKAVKYRSFVIFIKKRMTRITDTQLLNLYAEVCGNYGIKRHIPLYTSSDVFSPMTIGLVHPFIIVPDLRMNANEQRFVLLHELTHIKRLDILYKWAAQLTICLHWFNPLVYLMGKEINNSCELSCDEAIVRNSDSAARKIYGDTLLHSLAFAGTQKESPASLQLSKNAEQIKERLGAIMKHTKKSTAVTVITTLITVLVCAGSYVTGAYAAQSPSAGEEPRHVWEAMARRGDTYTYSQTGYYQSPYIFTLGWNLNEKDQKAYPDKASITLSDRTRMNVFFVSNCRKYAGDEDTLASLTLLIETLKEEYAGSFIPLESPIVVGLEYVGDRDVAELAEEYYQDHRLTDFTAVFPALDSDTQLAYCDQMFQDKSIAYFSSCLLQMAPEIVSANAEKTYLADNSFFFSSIVPFLTEQEIDEYLARAEKDGKASFTYALQEEKELIHNVESLKKSQKKESASLDQAAAQKEKQEYSNQSAAKKNKALQEELTRLVAFQADLQKSPEGAK